MRTNLLEIIKEYTDTPIEEITEDTEFISGLGLNSLDIISIISDTEDEFDMDIPTELVKDFIKIRDLEEYLDKHSKD